MDIVTQGLAGAVLAQSFSKGHETRLALVIGFLAGLLADIDALFTQSEMDPLLQLDF
ncbi:MAG: metal-dependent hydrolase, partial [Zetaproteobacteria bacterium CG_4_9_14_3_um_filter_53_7]